MKTETFVLVHGAFCGGWAWDAVAEGLRSYGHRVFTPTLAGLGDRAHLASPEIDLNTHIQDILDVFENEKLIATILLGWSYAGMVVTGVAQRIPDKLKHIIYLDALVPRNGEADKDLLDPEIVKNFENWTKQQNETWRVSPPPENLWIDRMTPQPVKTVTQPIEINNPASLKIKQTYIRCVGETYEPAIRTIEKATRRAKENGWDYWELNTDHMAPLTAPRELTKLLIDIVSQRPSSSSSAVSTKRGLLI